MRSLLVIVVIVASIAPSAQVARADDGGPHFRRTTPRAALAEHGGALVIGVPGGRAWGVESGLLPLPPAGSVLVVRLAVSDERVREAFVRVAYYASGVTRTRQLATSDSELVRPGPGALVAVDIDPPAGAVAYRVRVLARLVAPDERSSDDAVTALVRGIGDRDRVFGSLYSRLLP